MNTPFELASQRGAIVRVRGLVQGVGFRPTVWRLAQECGLAGDVRNDGEGVQIRVWGEATAIDGFCRRLVQEAPALSRIDALERAPLTEAPAGTTFEIRASMAGPARTGVAPDAATCTACLEEVFNPDDRRHRYPFTNCTHCGPRLSIVRGIPYDRANTSMRVFPMCGACQAEYDDPGNRRFHAQPNACPTCGPGVWLENPQGQRLAPSSLGTSDVVAAAGSLLRQGKILAMKGIGGFHLACDASDMDAVAELRRRKRRYRKPFALMARDIAVVRRYCRVDAQELALLQGTAAPIVLLDVQGPDQVAPDVAPGQDTLGFMLPYTPLHHLLLAEWDRPLVMTSGNLSEEPQCTGNAEVSARLAALADAFVLHDREIVNRVDDSVIQCVDGVPRLLRRARGYAPAPIRLPRGFEGVPALLALGGELKNTVCLIKDGQAILSQHLGDLEDARTAEEYLKTIALYQALFQHQPQLLAADMHPEYRSSRLAQEWSERDGLPVEWIQHHHAHIAACLADNGWALDNGPVLGVALDGLGYGEDGTIWGGELLLADYQRFQRLGYLAPVPMPGGVKAILEPWRNTYAHIMTHVGWDDFENACGDLDLARFLAAKPLDVLATMLRRGVNSPLTSSCGRLFDAVAAALGICRDEAVYEGQAAIELEAAAAQCEADAVAPYPVLLRRVDGAYQLDPAPLWRALFADLMADCSRPLIAARFHHGIAQGICALTRRLSEESGEFEAVALSGGVFQNRILFTLVSSGLREAGFQVLSHGQVPTNDGGLALGQAVVAAARCAATAS